MKSESMLLKFIKRLLLVDAAILAGVGVICLLVPGWRTWTDYSNGLVVACAVVLGFAAVSGYGGWQQTHGFGYQYSATVNPDNRHQQAMRAVRDRYGGLRLMLLAIAACLVPMGVAALLQFI